jgi:hypothetical protein
VIGYTLELEDPMLPHVEPALREPLERFGAVTVVLPRSTPANRAEALLYLVDGVCFPAAPTSIRGTTANRCTS